MSGCFATPLRFGPFVDFSGAFAPRDHGITAWEQDGALDIEMEIPRYGPNDVNVTSEPELSALVVTGNRTAADGKPISFRKCLAVSSSDFDHSLLTWSAANGVLHIRVPKTPKQVAIPVENQVAIAETSRAIEAVNQMAWPPAFTTTETPEQIDFKAVLPDTLTAENVDAHLRGGGVLSVAVRAHMETVRKDEFGHVIFSESQSSMRSTGLRVPLGTKPKDVKVKVDGHTIDITVKKHPATAAVEAPKA